MDGTRAAVPGCAAALPVLPEGEVRVAMPYKPAFPGESPPHVIRPGNDGRYEIRDLWCPVAPSAVGELRQRHPDALVALTRDGTPAPVPRMLAYVTDHPGASSRMWRNVETALAKLAAELGR